MSAGMNAGTRAVLLAAGQGKRMKSKLPKVLHEVLGRAIISRVIDAVDALMLEHIHIVVGHGSDQVKDYLSKHPPASPYSVHVQEPQLGTGHALMQVHPDLASFAGTLLVAAGDSPLLTTATLQSLLTRHKGQKAAITVLTAVVPEAKNYGRIVRNQSAEVVQIVEDKDASTDEKSIAEINTAIYSFEWDKVRHGLSALKNENRQGEYYLTDLIGWAFRQGLPVAAQQASDWQEVAGINSRAELAEVVQILKQRVNKQLCLQGITIVDPEATWIAPEAVIGADTVIWPGCLILGEVEIGNSCEIGPHTMMYERVKVGDRTVVCQSRVSNCEIGSDTHIGPFAHLRDGVSIGNEARIGNFVEVKKSTLGNHSKASHLSYVGDSTIGEHVNLGAGTITANYDHLSKTKSRTVIGNDVSTGSNSVLVAPVEIGSGSMVAAGSVITKNVPEGSLAVGRARQENKEGWALKRRARASKT